MKVKTLFTPMAAKRTLRLARFGARKASQASIQARRKLPKTHEQDETQNGRD